jgi:hypothetical protein
MPLFDQIERTETRVRHQNESSFDYLNTSARPGICAIREMLERWFEHLPNSAKADIRGRFRSGDEVQYESSFFELFWHELLCSSCYEVTTHPRVPNATTNPDFLASRAGVPQFYLEATLAMPPGDPAATRRLAELYQTLDRMASPDFFLEIQYRGSPQENVRGRALRQRLESWLEELNFDEISRLYQERNYGAVPTFTWPEHGVMLTFTPIPKGPQSRGQLGIRPIGIVAPMDMRMVRTHDDIRVALEGKATKYGVLELPLLVAVNVMDDFCEEADLWSALFGEEQLVATQQANGRWREDWGARAPNGAWYGREGPRNRLVSAVVVTHQLSPSNVRTRTLELIHNPWALHPMTPDSLQLVQRIICVPEGRISRHSGVSAADLLGIPEAWPVRPQE